MTAARIILLASLGLAGAACNQLSPEAFATGYERYQQGDYTSAMQHWQPLAEQGHARAQFNLGQMYRLGLGVAADDQQAVKWYTAAADADLPQAKHNLALMRREGQLGEPAPEPFSAANMEATALSPNPAGLSLSNLLALPAQHIMIQLIASPRQAEPERLLQAYQGQWPTPPLLTRTESKGRLWYVLLLGPYPDQAQANAALGGLPQAVQQHKPWLRSVASLQAALR